MVVSKQTQWVLELENELDAKRQQNLFRQFAQIEHQGRWVSRDSHTMLNQSGNDYLGLASDRALREAFWQSDLAQSQALGSASSRLLTGNYPIYTELESLMAQRFKSEAVLLFNSGYHANIGILPALTNKHTLLLMDKLVHASLIDGARLSGADFLRYRHNDYQHLERLLQQQVDKYQRIIIVTESIFSMDGYRGVFAHVS